MGNGSLAAKDQLTGRQSRTADLLRAYHKRGDKVARQQLVELYLPLVDSFMRRYARRTEDYDDLYQVGCIGLINAIDRFDLDHGGELAAFAVPNIAGEIRRYLRDRSDSVRLPRRVLELRSGAAGAQAELRAKLGREPTTAEVATSLGEEEGDVALALDGAAAQALELLPDDGDAGAQSLDETEDRLFLSDAFRGLDERERRVLFLRYLRDAEPDAIARELGVSRRQLTRITDGALKKLRMRLERPSATTARARREPAEPEESEREIEQPDREAPKPAAATTHSGKLLVRMPQTLHSELARAAEREGVSLNQFITGSLASAVHWRAPADTSTGPGGPAPLPEGRTRDMRKALMANVLLLAVIAALAIALLVIAVSHG